MLTIKTKCTAIHLWSCLFLLCFASVQNISATPQLPPSNNPYLWQMYTQQDGLLEGEIRGGCQASDGSLWFAGQQGVCKYDGTNWTLYTPQNSPAPRAVTTIYCDRNGVIWIGSESGITRFQDGTWTHFTQKDGLPGKIVTAITETQDGTLWAGCGTRNWISIPHQGGLAKWTGLKWEPIQTPTPTPYINSLFQSENKTLWLATTDGILQYANNNWRTLNEGLPNKHVLTIEQSLDGIIWAGTENGIAKLANNRWHTSPLSDHQKNTKTLIKTKDNVLWAFIGTSLYYLLNDQWQKHPSPIAGPGDLSHCSMFKTQLDELWMTGTRAIRFNYGNAKWTTFRSFNGPPSENLQGQLFFENKNMKVLEFDNKQTKSHSDLEWPILFDNKGTGWCIQKGELQSWQNNKWTLHPKILHKLHTLHQTSNGTLWFTGQYKNQQRIVQLQDNNWTFYEQTDWGAPFPYGFLKIVETPQEHLWFVPENGSKLIGFGTLQFNGTDLIYQNLHTAYHATHLDTMDTWHYEMSNRVYDITTNTQGTVWIATGLGLITYKNETFQKIETGPGNKKTVRLYFDNDEHLWVSCGTTKHRSGGLFVKRGVVWSQYTIEEGLPSHNIWAIKQSSKGILWFGTDAGVGRFDGENWITYNSESHLPEDDIRFIKEDHAGNLWFGMGWRQNKGWVTRYRPDKLPPDTYWTFLPQNKLASGDLLISWAGKDPWKDTSPEHLLFSWQIDNNKWSLFSPALELSLSDLSSGKHIFRVRTQDADGNIDPTPATFEFSVRPPTWQQPWFIGLMATFIGTIGYLSRRVIKRGHQIRQTNQALSEANKQLFAVNLNLTQEIDERARLDTQIQNLQYLYNLRAKLTESYTIPEAIQITGQAILDILSALGGIRIELDGQTYAFGQTQIDDLQTYQRDLMWSERARGTLTIYSHITLSESQERTLLDETAGQLTRTLEARELHMQLLQSARLVSLGQMAAGVAHELNQPLGGISATAEDYYLRLQDNMPVSPEQLSESFKRILSMVDRMSNTVEHLRVFSRDTSQEPGNPIQINDVIHSSLDIIGTQLKNHGIDVQFNLTDNLPRIIGHPYQLEQIFLNLLGNARDAFDSYTPANTQFKTITLSTKQENNTVIATIQDNGSGIAQEHLNRIFEPFYTTKAADKGTGLGLSITYAIVKNHGGDITCMSSKNQGTTFQVKFPIPSDED